MTAQIPDEFRYEGEVYSLVGIKGEGLYTPQDFRITPQAASTACYRGYVMKYDCIDGQLVLDGMTVNSEEGPTINGVEPVESLDGFRPRQVMAYTVFGAQSLTKIYQNLKLKTKFTGSILLAKDFISSMYVHMGFQRPFAFRTVLELQIQDGDIINVSDLSERMEELRMRGPETGARPDSRSDEDVREWIDGTFSLDY
ncbi:MAG: hypothetical protein RTU30_06975 [Candidatus Thorarchaeota archaeon]